MNEDITFNLEKFKAVIHYIISKCGLKDNVDKNVLCKLVYFSDFDHYEINEVPITGEKYIKKSRGPVPIHFNEATSDLQKEGKITISNQNKYSSSSNPDISLLTMDEAELIDGIIEKLSDLTSNEISEYSHGDLPWRLAKTDNELDYEAVFYREPEYSVRKYS